jgi:hypothetical protein
MSPSALKIRKTYNGGFSYFPDSSSLWGQADAVRLGSKPNKSVAESV